MPNPALLPAAFDARALIADFHAQMRAGLDGRPRSIAMRPAFVSRPRGDERGRFAALDLGGTNVRATVMELLGAGGVRVLASDSFRLPAVSGAASDLFDPMADFLGARLEAGADYSVGFIFAFPMRQDGVRSGRLTKWTKEFAFAGVEGEDPAALLQDAMNRRASAFPSLERARVSALANDTVGVLAAGAYLDRRCDVGMIVGTGTNLAIALPARMTGGDVPAPAGDPNEMIFNMECGDFDGVRAIQTEFDRRLDAESDTEGQLIEKMISGRYLGELARLQVADVSERGGGFAGWLDAPSAFAVPYAFDSERVSDILHDESRDLRAAEMVLAMLGAPPSSLDERARLREICARTAERSARLAAMSVVASASYADPNLRRERIVAVDGSVYRGVPGYAAAVNRAIADIAEDITGERDHGISVVYLRDGSGLGAGVVAAVAG